jgi:hypothetical protein
MENYSILYSSGLKTEFNVSSDNLQMFKNQLSKSDPTVVAIIKTSEMNSVYFSEDKVWVKKTKVLDNLKPYNVQHVIEYFKFKIKPTIKDLVDHYAILHEKNEFHYFDHEPSEAPNTYLEVFAASGKSNLNARDIISSFDVVLNHLKDLLLVLNKPHYVIKTFIYNVGETKLFRILVMLDGSEFLTIDDSLIRLTLES